MSFGRFTSGGRVVLSFSEFPSEASRVEPQFLGLAASSSVRDHP